ncbi:DUF6731 family protein [Clostridium perfringens]|uniref:DUF6731 family protein n=1 Tax=Clostridium perfringens TaxID=1502 RepID=UPI001C857538|nr:DUF6731 family protein [Clostridium perfringens]MCX0376157.1 hypothetical protein [Clostridium perfringens]MDK0582276.1 hypothetical protein [Clostridium perfringens]
MMKKEKITKRKLKKKVQKKVQKNESVTKTKEFTVEFLQLLEEKDLDNNQVSKIPIDLTNYLSKVSTLDANKRNIQYHDDILRLQSIRRIPGKSLFNNLLNMESLWELHFIKIKDCLVQGLLENDVYLEDGLEEFLGSTRKLVDSSTVLYDSQNSVFIIEKNINLPISAILEFFSKSLKNPKLNFGIIPDTTKLDTISSSNFIKSFELTLVNLNDDNFKSKLLNEENFGAILPAVKALSTFNNDKLYLKISINANKKDCMSADELKSSIPKIMNNGGYVNKLVVSLKENEDSQVQKINLYDSRLKDTQKMTYEKNKAKKHSDISFLLQEAYNRKKAFIDNLNL